MVSSVLGQEKSLMQFKQFTLFAVVIAPLFLLAAAAPEPTGTAEVYLFATDEWKDKRNAQ
ncbi:hypothetical protein FOMPIDRAFT_89213 [Fomitopsis schrenkii]|uniref:Uncharacterized protein n=1 Tax=Fomitopsis schrenkii TaxID=2126942 RepID=S8E2C5_FOMSC|nr:hypothetical protein FOMPIDRAFT_89213 [Fomitopsis schrenkii]